MAMKIGMTGFVALLLAACSMPTRVPIVDVTAVPQETLTRASAVQVFMLGSAAVPPKVTKHLGDVTAFSCKHLMNDPPASRGNALTQLRLKALELGADGVIDVTFDTRGTDPWGTNCWESIQASGVAVQFSK